MEQKLLEFNYKDTVIQYRLTSSNAEDVGIAGFKKNKKTCVIELVQNESDEYSKGQGSEAMRNFLAKMAKENVLNIYTFVVYTEEYYKKDTSDDVEKTLGRLVSFYEKLGFQDLVGYEGQDSYVDMSLEIDPMGIPINVSAEIKKPYIDDIKDDLYNIISGMVNTKSEARSILGNVDNIIDVLDTPKQVYDYISTIAGEKNEKSYEIKIDEILSELTLIYNSLGYDYGEDSEFTIVEKKKYIKLVSDLYIVDKDYAKMNDKYVSITSEIINGEDLSNGNSTYIHGNFPENAPVEEKFRKITITTGAMISEIILPEDRNSYHLNSISAVSREAQLLGHEMGAEMARYLLDTKFNSPDERNAIRRKRAQFQRQVEDTADLIKNNYFGIKTIKTFLSRTLGVDLSQNTESLFDHLYVHKTKKIELLRDVTLTESDTDKVTRGFAAISDENEPIFFVSKDGKRSVDDFNYLSGNSVDYIFDKYTLSSMNAMNHESIILGTLSEPVYNREENTISPKK